MSLFGDIHCLDSETEETGLASLTGIFPYRESAQHMHVRKVTFGRPAQGT